MEKEFTVEKDTVEIPRTMLDNLLAESRKWSNLRFRLFAQGIITDSDNNIMILK